MKYLSVLIVLFILVSSCTFPVSVEENNVECENTKLVKNLLGNVKYTRIWIGEEDIGTYSEFKVTDNYFVATNDYGTARYNLCEMISASVSGYYLRLRF